MGALLLRLLAWLTGGGIAASIALAGLGAGAGYASGKIAGWFDCHEKMEVAALQAEIAVLRTDARIQSDAADTGSIQTAALEARAAHAEEAFDALRDEIAKQPADRRACRAATADDLRRLQSVRRRD